MYNKNQRRDQPADVSRRGGRDTPIGMPQLNDSATVRHPVWWVTTGAIRQQPAIF